MKSLSKKPKGKRSRSKQSSKIKRSKSTKIKRSQSKRKLKKCDGASKLGSEKMPPFKKDTIKIKGLNYPIVEYSKPDGRYGRTDHILGKGAFKQVYTAIDFKTGKNIAWSVIDLKKIDNSGDTNEIKRIKKERIMSEVTLLNKMTEHKQPYVLEFLGSTYDKVGKTINIFTELYSGGSLSDYIKTNHDDITIDDIKKWCKQILICLDFLHGSDIIHRDIKLDNIFISNETKDIFLGDYGLSYYYINRKDLTKKMPNESVGTPEYMAKEMFIQETYDQSVDMYAFGMCLLEMLTDEPPYNECPNVACIMKKVLDDEPPLSLQKVNSRWINVVLKLISPNPGDRPSAFDLLNNGLFD